MNMKASIIFREDQNPIFRAKTPLNFFGYPFRSAIEFAEPDNLSFAFTTLFRSGPSFNLSYRPNHSFNPLSLSLKAGIGLFGSPIDSPLIFTAEFNLPANQPPRFFLHFKPQLGDFTLRRSLQSHVANFNLPCRNSISLVDDDDDVAALSLSKGKSVDGGESSTQADCVLSGHGQGIGCSQSQVLNRIVLPSVEINARSKFKIRDRAAVKFRWSMRFPANMKKEDFTAKIPLSKMPYLALGKIKIERLVDDSEQENNETAEAVEFSALKKPLDGLWTESRWLKKNIEQLRSEISEQKGAPATLPVESRKKMGA